MYFFQKQLQKNIKLETIKKIIIFLFGGLFNTILTYLIYYYLNNLLTYVYSYTIAYIIGIVYSYFYNSIFVFKSKISKDKFLLYPIIYLIQYLISLLIIYICIDILFVHKNYAPIISIVLLIPISYLLNKKILNVNGS
jgi:putative flippase GtrA